MYFDWVLQTKTKVITIANQMKGKDYNKPITCQRKKTSELSKARENAGDQVAIGFSFESDWLRE